MYVVISISMRGFIHWVISVIIILPWQLIEKFGFLKTCLPLVDNFSGLFGKLRDFFYCFLMAHILWLCWDWDQQYRDHLTLLHRSRNLLIMLVVDGSGSTSGIDKLSFQQMPIREACHVAVQRSHPSKHKLWKHALVRQKAKGKGPLPLIQIVSLLMIISICKFLK